MSKVFEMQGHANAFYYCSIVSLTFLLLEALVTKVVCDEKLFWLSGSNSVVDAACNIHTYLHIEK